MSKQTISLLLVSKFKTMKFKTTTTFFLFFFFSTFLFATQNIKDTLNTDVSLTLNDTNKVRKLIELSDSNLYANNKLAMEYAKQAFKLSKKLNSKTGMGTSLYSVGNIYYTMGEFDNALNCFQTALLIAQSEKNKGLLRNVYSGIGLVYLSQSDLPISLEYLLKALRISEEIKDEKTILHDMANVGIVYLEMKNYSEAIKYYTSVLVMAEATNNKLLKMNQLTNLGTVFAEQAMNTVLTKTKIDLLNKALENYQKALVISQETTNINIEIVILLNLAALYSELYELVKNPKEKKEFKEKAQEYFISVLELSKKYENQYYLACIEGNLGNFYRNTGEFKKAEFHLKTALEISKSLNALSLVKDHEKYTYQLYDTIGNYRKALEHYKNFISVRDTILNEEKAKSNMKLQMQYEFDKKEALSLADKKREIQVLKEKEKRQAIFFYSAIGGFLALVVIAFLIFRNLKQTRLQNKIIQSKNKDILDSITYAKRIQEAILPSEHIWKEALPDSFILYMPKDIVAGDFYWMEIITEQQNYRNIIFAACDCTGHGVPGAMVSVVCANALYKAIIEEGITEPGKILDRTSEIVVEKLNRNNEDIKDGMDASLCTLELNENNTIQWAGANNPLWIIRNKELIEYKPNKQPIGKMDNSQHFTTHAINLIKGDIIYIFTDGFADQFGGEKGKKYMIKNVKKLLLSIAHLPMPEQKQKLAEEFAVWKGSNEQVDDVCVIGVRI